MTEPWGSWPGDVDRIPAGQTILTDLSDELERWTDLLLEAIDAEVDARIQYDDAYSDELTASHRSGVQMAIIKDITLGRCKDERNRLTRAEGALRKARARVVDVSARLTAAMAQAKYSGLADGGSR